MAAGRKLLTWRTQTCPSRAKEPAEALARSCGLFAAAWDQLTEARSCGDAFGSAAHELVGSITRTCRVVLCYVVLASLSS